jgi:hypothetical protein
MHLFQKMNTLMAITTAAVLAGCGGGGGTASTSTSYVAAASAGELIRYNLDTTALTYSYTIEESAYGLTGQQGSGTLTRNSDGTYTPSDFAGKIAVLESGLVLGAIAADLNADGSNEVLPFVGASNNITTAADAAGVYNFISRQCGTNTCSNHYGTVKVETSGQWTSCVGGNLAETNPTCTDGASGAVGSFASGLASITVGGVSAGTMFIFKDATNGQKAMLMDLNGQSVLGKGAFYAATQALPANADGVWHYTHSNGTLRGYVEVNSTNYVDHVHGAPQTYPGSFTTNLPWAGFVTTADGNILMPTGAGLYAGYFPQVGSMSIGIRP